MKEDLILLRLGEITLKGKNRHRFEDKVFSNVVKALKRFPNARVIKDYGRIYVAPGGEPLEGIIGQLKKVFGLHSFSPVSQADLDLDSIRETALRVMKNLPVPPKTFKVSVKRANKSFPHNSLEMNHLVASYILPRMKGLKADVHNPDVELRVEIRDKAAYIYSEVIPGLGGYPAGSSGKAMLMLSGGIDSPVAGWLAMKKGLTVEPVHFHSFPFTSERAQQKVVELAEKLAEYTDEIHLHFVPFTDIQTRLKQSCPEHLLITIMRRVMLRITEMIAVRRNAMAIVTGESLGQVASQTLSSLNTIGRVAKLPVLRPLIMMDKEEIIDMARRIGTYDISIQPFEDCCTIFLPKSPSTNPNVHVVERIESRLDWLDQLMEQAVEKTELRHISETNVSDAFLF